MLCNGLSRSVRRRPWVILSRDTDCNCNCKGRQKATQGDVKRAALRAMTMTVLDSFGVLPFRISALRGEGVPSKADIVSNLSKGGCVNLRTRRRGGQKI